MTNIFVGGIPFAMSEAELGELFGKHGKVVSAKIILDRATGKSKGFGFVEMADEASAKSAQVKLNGSYIGTRKLFVNLARPREAGQGPGGHGADGFRATGRADVGYGNGGYGGGRY